MIEAQEYKTLKEYKAANELAHKTCSKLKGYNSKDYSNPILTVNKTYLLVLVKEFEAELKEVGFEFKEFKKSYIFVPEEL